MKDNVTRKKVVRSVAEALKADRETVSEVWESPAWKEFFVATMVVNGIAVMLLVALFVFN
jgi:hypothetical protein